MSKSNSFMLVRLTTNPVQVVLASRRSTCLVRSGTFSFLGSRRGLFLSVNSLCGDFEERDQWDTASLDILICYTCHFTRGLFVNVGLVAINGCVIQITFKIQVRLDCGHKTFPGGCSAISERHRYYVPCVVYYTYYSLCLHVFSVTNQKCRNTDIPPTKRPVESTSWSTHSVWDWALLSPSFVRQRLPCETRPRGQSSFLSY